MGTILWDCDGTLRQASPHPASEHTSSPRTHTLLMTLRVTTPAMAASSNTRLRLSIPMSTVRPAALRQQSLPAAHVSVPSASSQVRQHRCKNKAQQKLLKTAKKYFSAFSQNFHATLVDIQTDSVPFRRSSAMPPVSGRYRCTPAVLLARARLYCILLSKSLCLMKSSSCVYVLIAVNTQD